MAKLASVSNQTTLVLHRKAIHSFEFAWGACLTHSSTSFLSLKDLSAVFEMWNGLRTQEALEGGVFSRRAPLLVGTEE